MRPVVMAWLSRHGVPGELLPDYFMLAAIAVLVGSLIALRLAKHDGASVRAHRARDRLRLPGGAGRRLPVRGVARGPRGAGRRIVAPGDPRRPRRVRWSHRRDPGRSSILKLSDEPLAPFFDRVAIGAGLTFALVRTGCFLAGCDYGVPTAGMWGVRFPPGSLAAIDHLRRGFVPPGAPSLPVHRPSSTRRRWACARGWRRRFPSRAASATARRSRRSCRSTRRVASRSSSCAAIAIAARRWDCRRRSGCRWGSRSRSGLRSRCARAGAWRRTRSRRPAPPRRSRHADAGDVRPVADVTGRVGAADREAGQAARQLREARALRHPGRQTARAR